MKTFTYTISDVLGIHARPAGMLAKEASRFHSSVRLRRGDQEVSAASMIAVMTMGIRSGDELTFDVDGPDETEAAAHLEQFLIEKRF